MGNNCVQPLPDSCLSVLQGGQVVTSCLITTIDAGTVWRELARQSVVAGRVRGVTAARRLLQSPTTSNDSLAAPADPPPPPPPPAPQQQQQQEQQQQQQQPPAAPPPATQQAAQQETDFSEYAALDANITYCASTASQTIVLETPEYSAHALLDDCLTARSLTVGIPLTTL
jgi:hypothetical protein